MTYVWQQSLGGNWTIIRQGTKFLVPSTTLPAGLYIYRCIVSNHGGPVPSDNVTLYLYGECILCYQVLHNMTQVFAGPPNITAHPTSHLTTTEMNVTLGCEGAGQGPIRYRWEISNVNGGPWARISSSNEKSFVVRDLEQSQRYRCAVSNAAGTVTSNAAIVTVLSECVKITTALYSY